MMTTATIAQTTQDAKILILADLWIQERETPYVAEFMAYNDIGLPLAYMQQNNICEPSEIGEAFIDECFDLLLAGLELEDQGFSQLSELLGTDEHKIISLEHGK